MSNTIKEHEWAYIYALLEPNTETIRYIGWAIDVFVRYKRHFHKSELDKVCHRTNWIKSLLTIGKKPLVQVIEKVSFYEWSNREKYWIKYYKDLGYDLVNSTPGGDGGGHPMTPENKEKLRLVHLGAKRSVEARKNMSDAHKGNRPNQATRDKMSDIRKGKPIPDDVRKKISDSAMGRPGFMLGKSQTEEAKEKMSISKMGDKNPMYGKHPSQDTIEKRKLAFSGKNYPNYGKKMSNALSRYYGVSPRKENGRIARWHVVIRINGVYVRVGKSYKTELEAAHAYDKYVIENNLDRPLNFPDNIHPYWEIQNL